MNRGTHLVILMLVAGLAAAVGAIWHQYRQTRETLRLWGPEMAGLIDRGRSVLLTDWRHGDPRKIAEDDPARGDALKVDISDARGLVHFRRSLLEKASSELDDEGSVQRPQGTAFEMQYSVSFTDNRAAEMLGFDLENRIVWHLGAAAVLTERTAKGMEQFFREKLSEAQGLP
jgi:hypothetical protein